MRTRIKGVYLSCLHAQVLALIFIVVDAVVADLTARDVVEALGVVAVDQRVSVVVDRVGAVLDDAARIERALGIEAVDEQVSVVVDAVVADLRQADGRGCAVGIGAVDEAVGVVVPVYFSR